MNAIVYHGKEDFRFEKTADPKLEGECDAIVRVSRTAICGSDLHLWHGGWRRDRHLGGFAVGHEFLGVVEETGRACAASRGDRVLASCTVGCGECAMCRRGVYSGCITMTKGGGASNVFGFSTACRAARPRPCACPSPTPTCSRPGELGRAGAVPDRHPAHRLHGRGDGRGRPGDSVVVFGCGPWACSRR
jgi:threonine dehydrogenase-like Zn-dependent dehydrogenase